jgi:hypothetical protein
MERLLRLKLATRCAKMRGVDDTALSAARRSNLCCHPSLVVIATNNEAFL